MATVAPIVSGNFPTEQDKALYMGITMEPSGIAMDRMSIFTSKTSNQQYEIISTLGEWGLFDFKQVGKSPNQDSASEAWKDRVYHRTFGKRMDITMEGLMDDPKGLIRQVWDAGKNLRRVYEYTLEQDHWNYLVNLWSSATSTSYIYRYPAGGSSYYPIFSLLHPTQNPGETYRNRFTNSAQLNRATLEAAVTQMALNNLNLRGMLQGWDPEQLLVGYGNAPTAWRLVQNGGKPESADNDRNWPGIAGLRVVAPKLFSNDGRWALTAAKEHLNFYTFDRMGLTTMTLSQNDTLNNTRVIAARNGRRGFTPFGWFGGSMGA